ncbi:MAG TPA: protein kinase [Candidatus Acidoferrales bacterium]|nr:protein kinase [Candidatus Acidoferrales bacterium]
MNPTPHPETLGPGRRLGHYEIQSRLGLGGMGAVYLAFDSRLNRAVALKVLNPDLSEGTGVQLRLAREAQAASALNHPNIVTIYEIASDQGVDFIAMERVEGETLAKVIARRPGLREALGIAIQIADALAAAHSAGIVHRDLKPSNVMVTGRRLVKVLDFGIAKVTPAGSPETRATMTMPHQTGVAGTWAYMSPEQAEGKDVDSRSDIFSFGCVLYEMFSRQRAFQAETEVGTLAAVVAKDPAPLTEVAPGLPRSIERTIGLCLNKNRLERWQSAADVKLVLEAALADLDAVLPSRESRWRGRLAAAAAGLLVAVAGFAAWQWLLPAAKPLRAPLYRRVTSGSGLSAFPALSKDGNLLAFASDQGGGNLDIYVRQIGGREPIRLTEDPADDSEPSISPDSARIAFRSERSGGGVWVAPALGGEAVLLAQNGRSPRYSPDGHWIVYWEGRETQSVLPGTARIWVMESGGGQPRQVGTDLSVALHPLWSPQGDSVLVLGRKDTEASIDWWVVPVSTPGPSRKTGMLAALTAQGLRRAYWQTIDAPLEWRATGVLFPAGTGESLNLWEMPLNGGPAIAVTRAPGYHAHASSAGSRLAFSSLDWKPRVISIPLADANKGVTSGPPRPYPGEYQTDSTSPALSADGRFLTYRSLDLGRWAVRVYDARSGRDVAVVAGPRPQYNPRISGDGAVIAYGDGSQNLFFMKRTGGSVEQICKGCGTTMGISPDGGRISYEPVTSEDLTYYDVARRSNVIVAQRPSSDTVLTAGRFSPDGRWMAFHARTRATTAQVFVIRIDGSLPVPRERWIAITDGQNEEMEPAWSPDGKLLYYLSDRDGFRCIWARRLNPETGQTAGEPFEVAAFHTARASLKRLPGTTGLTGLSVVPGRLVFAMGELTGNIWLEEKQ